MHFSTKVGLFANRNDAKITVFKAFTQVLRVGAVAHIPLNGADLERCEWNLLTRLFLT